MIEMLKRWRGTWRARRCALPVIAFELGRLNERLSVMTATIRDIGQAQRSEMELLTRSIGEDLNWCRNDICAALLKRKPPTKGAKKK